MNTLQPQLDDLQQWMLTAITDPGRDVPSVEVANLILPSRQRSAVERLAVYQNAYFARLLEVLRELFPCTRDAVGDELFDQFAIGYLQAFPPHSYTLARLADNLVDYLDTTRPTDWGGFIVELARLEQAIDRIFDGPGPEELPPFILPDDADESLRLVFVPGFELHAFRFPVSGYYTDWKAGRQPPWPQASPQFVALFRRDYVVRRLEPNAAQFELLHALWQGQTLREALTSHGGAHDLCPFELREWFARWGQAGFFSNIG